MFKNATRVHRKMNPEPKLTESILRGNLIHFRFANGTIKQVNCYIFQSPPVILDSDRNTATWGGIWICRKVPDGLAAITSFPRFFSQLAKYFSLLPRKTSSQDVCLPVHDCFKLHNHFGEWEVTATTANALARTCQLNQWHFRKRPLSH